MLGPRRCCSAHPECNVLCATVGCRLAKCLVGDRCQVCWLQGLQCVEHLGRSRRCWAQLPPQLLKNILCYTGGWYDRDGWPPRVRPEPLREINRRAVRRYWEVMLLGKREILRILDPYDPSGQREPDTDDEDSCGVGGLVAEIADSCACEKMSAGYVRTYCCTRRSVFRGSCKVLYAPFCSPMHLPWVNPLWKLRLAVDDLEADNPTYGTPWDLLLEMLGLPA